MILFAFGSILTNEKAGQYVEVKTVTTILNKMCKVNRNPSQFRLQFRILELNTVQIINQKNHLCFV